MPTTVTEALQGAQTWVLATLALGWGVLAYILSSQSRRTEAIAKDLKDHKLYSGMTLVTKEICVLERSSIGKDVKSLLGYCKRIESNQKEMSEELRKVSDIVNSRFNTDTARSSGSERRDK